MRPSEGKEQDGRPGGSFEEELAVLEKAVDELESGDLTIEDAIRSFESGFGAMKRCYSILRATQKRIEALVAEEGLDGDPSSGGDAGGDGALGGLSWQPLEALRSLSVRLTARDGTGDDGSRRTRRGRGADDACVVDPATGED